MNGKKPCLGLLRLYTAGDGSSKSLWLLEDKNIIESIFFRFNEREIGFCLSTSVGCACGCKFCASAYSGGWLRNLQPQEILDQVDATLLDKKLNNRETLTCNISFMGIGEPLLNYPAVTQVMQVLSRESAFNALIFSLATVGITPRLRDLVDLLTEGVWVNLKISLHASSNSLRDALIPVNRTYPLQDVLKAAEIYATRSGKLVCIKYLLIHGLNDSRENLKDLVSLLKDKPFECELSFLNPVEGSPLRISPLDTFREFRDELVAAGIPARIWKSFGTEIEAGCGQLRRRTLLCLNN